MHGEDKKTGDWNKLYCSKAVCSRSPGDTSNRKRRENTHMFFLKLQENLLLIFIKIRMVLRNKQPVKSLEQPRLKPHLWLFDSKKKKNRNKKYTHRLFLSEYASLKHQK